MTLVQLRHLVALAETASFSKAAARVHLTQPALSRSIRALEDELGHALFDRLGHRVELTTAGGELLARARALIDDATELEGHARRLARGEAAVLRVGLGSGPSVLLAEALLLAAAQRGPGNRIELAQGATALLLQRLRARQLDALVVDLRSLPPAVDLQIEQVHELPGAYLVRPGHPLAPAPGREPLRYEALRPYPLAAPPLSDEVARVVTSLYGPQAHPEQAVTLRSEDVRRLADVASQTDAVLLGVRACAPSLVALELDPPMRTTGRFGLVTLARRSPAPGLALLRQLMTERMAA